MIYPPFLQQQDVIGITAPSAGIDPQDQPAFDLSLANIRRAGWRIRETADVRAGGLISAPAAQRAAQFHDLLRDDDVRMIWCASGGDFLVDMLEYVDFEEAAAHPKWIQGYSDPTSLLYAITTRYDIATIYGTNAGGLDMTPLHPSLETNLRILRGETPVQHSFDLFEGARTDRQAENGGGYALSQPVCWETPHGPVHVRGRLLGGCMDCLSDILSTPYDGTQTFLDRYASDGILWYFDIFALSAESVYRTLWRMKVCGWFDHAVGAIFGRVFLPNSPLGLSYREMITRALPDLPVTLEADIGHVPPRMTVVNGSMATLDVADGRARLSMAWL